MRGKEQSRVATSCSVGVVVVQDVLKNHGDVVAYPGLKARNEYQADTILGNKIGWPS